MFSHDSGMFPPEAFSRIYLLVLALVAITVLVIEDIDPVPAQVLFGLVVGYLVWSYFWAGYEVHLTLGPGGNPATVSGFFWTKFHAFFCIDSVFAPPAIPHWLTPQTGYLRDSLPTRWGPRPLMKGLAPQRQFNQFAGNQQEMFNKTNNMLKKFLEERSAYLLRDRTTGHVSKASYSIWVKPNCATQRCSQRNWFLDIGHPHEIDGSLHFSLHPDDVRAVIQAGYGERHPLARRNWWWRLFWVTIYRKSGKELKPWGLSGRTPVNDGLVFVYAPRTDEELEVVKKILEASCWYIARRVDKESESVDDKTASAVP